MNALDRAAVARFAAPAGDRPPRAAALSDADGAPRGPALPEARVACIRVACIAVLALMAFAIVVAGNGHAEPRPAAMTASLPQEVQP